jgi:hypothetical protein
MTEASRVQAWAWRGAEKRPMRPAPPNRTAIPQEVEAGQIFV